jgi:hypothetical protein
MNIPVIPIQDALILHAITKRPYVVVIQFRRKARAYINCANMTDVRETIKRHKKIRDVTYIYYNIPELQHIEAYDARDKERYV